MVTVISGANESDLPLEGKTVAEARQALGPIYNISPEATAQVNAREVDGSYALRGGDELTFVTRTAEKG